MKDFGKPISFNARPSSKVKFCNGTILEAGNTATVPKLWPTRSVEMKRVLHNLKMKDSLWIQRCKKKWLYKAFRVRQLGKGKVLRKKVSAVGLDFVSLLIENFLCNA